MMPAASNWFKWNKDSLAGPFFGEWCLWSMITKGNRNYFSGKLFKGDNGKVYLQWDGFTAFEPDHTVYFARINSIKED